MARERRGSTAKCIMPDDQDNVRVLLMRNVGVRALSAGMARNELQRRSRAQLNHGKSWPLAERQVLGFMRDNRHFVWTGLDCAGVTKTRSIAEHT
jgi:hypothetical protein